VLLLFALIEVLSKRENACWPEAVPAAAEAAGEHIPLTCVCVKQWA
jgi:hypothetical protein